MAARSEQHRGVRFTLEREPGGVVWTCLIRVPKALSGRKGVTRLMCTANRRFVRRRAIRFIDAICNAASSA